MFINCMKYNDVFSTPPPPEAESATLLHTHSLINLHHFTYFQTSVRFNQNIKLANLKVSLLSLAKEQEQLFSFFI